MMMDDISWWWMLYHDDGWKRVMDDRLGWWMKSNRIPGDTRRKRSRVDKRSRGVTSVITSSKSCITLLRWGSGKVAFCSKSTPVVLARKHKKTPVPSLSGKPMKGVWSIVQARLVNGSQMHTDLNKPGRGALFTGWTQQVSLSEFSFWFLAWNYLSTHFNPIQSTEVLV